MKNVREMLIVDPFVASIGGTLGASSVTAYIESAAGAAEGARTGPHSIFIGLFFLTAIALAPFAGRVTEAAAPPALILVGVLTISQATRINFTILDTAIPAFVSMILIPLIYSIAHGIGYGFVAYALIKLLTGRGCDVRPNMCLVAAASVAYFIAEARLIP